MENRWHYIKLNNLEYLILGYNPKKYDCLVVCLGSIHSNDRKDLDYIVNSEAAQKEAYLVSILVNSPYAGGGTWWEHLMPKAFFAPMYQVKAHIAPMQYAILMKSHYLKETEIEVSRRVHREIAEASYTFTPTQEIKTTIPIELTNNTNDILYSRIGCNASTERTDAPLAKIGG